MSKLSPQERFDKLLGVNTVSPNGTIGLINFDSLPQDDGQVLIIPTKTDSIETTIILLQAIVNKISSRKSLWAWTTSPERNDLDEFKNIHSGTNIVRDAQELFELWRTGCELPIINWDNLTFHQPVEGYSKPITPAQVSALQRLYCRQDLNEDHIRFVAVNIRPMMELIKAVVRLTSLEIDNNITMAVMLNREIKAYKKLLTVQEPFETQYPTNLTSDIPKLNIHRQLMNQIYDVYAIVLRQDQNLGVADHADVTFANPIMEKPEVESILEAIEVDELSLAIHARIFERAKTKTTTVLNAAASSSKQNIPANRNIDERDEEIKAKVAQTTNTNGTSKLNAAAKPFHPPAQTQVDTKLDPPHLRWKRVPKPQANTTSSLPIIQLQSEFAPDPQASTEAENSSPSKIQTPVPPRSNFKRVPKPRASTNDTLPIIPPKSQFVTEPQASTGVEETSRSKTTPIPLRLNSNTVSIAQAPVKSAPTLKPKADPKSKTSVELEDNGGNNIIARLDAILPPGGKGNQKDKHVEAEAENEDEEEGGALLL